MSASKEHGKRNQKLSTQLFSDAIYFDWVVTTAFYSAIHFVEFKILPIEINKKHCKNISEVKAAYQVQGRHAAREKLVRQFLPKISVQYKWLDDQSRYSRYVTYKVNKNQADKALQYLREIEKDCT